MIKASLRWLARLEIKINNLEFVLIKLFINNL